MAKKIIKNNKIKNQSKKPSIHYMSIKLLIK